MGKSERLTPKNILDLDGKQLDAEIQVIIAAQAKRPKLNLWTKKEDLILIRLRAAGVSWRTIAKTLGRTRNATRLRFLKLNGNS